MKQSAGILVYRIKNDSAEVLLVHPGGPFWAKKDSWSIPKGELKEGEDNMQAAKREFKEELGIEPPDGELIDLGSAKSSGSMNNIQAVKSDIELSDFHCASMVRLEWPPKSGQQLEFPEVDKAEWFDLKIARQKAFKSQAIFFDRLADYLKIKLPAELQQQSLL